MKKIITFVLVSIICIMPLSLSYANSGGHAIRDYFEHPKSEAIDFESFSSSIYTVLKSVGIGLAVCVMVVIAISYMTASTPQKRAMLKSRLGLYIAGVVLLLGGVSILGIYENMVNSVTSSFEKTAYYRDYPDDEITSISFSEQKDFRAKVASGEIPLEDLTDDDMDYVITRISSNELAALSDKDIKYLIDNYSSFPTDTQANVKETCTSAMKLWSDGGYLAKSKANISGFNDIFCKPTAALYYYLGKKGYITYNNNLDTINLYDYLGKDLSDYLGIKEEDYSNAKNAEKDPVQQPIEAPQNNPTGDNGNSGTKTNPINQPVEPSKETSTKLVDPTAIMSFKDDVPKAVKAIVKNTYLIEEISFCNMINKDNYGESILSCINTNHSSFINNTLASLENATQQQLILCYVYNSINKNSDNCKKISAYLETYSKNTLIASGYTVK